MDYKKLLIVLGFNLKENTVGVFSKKYPQADNYCLEVDLEKKWINYGEKIKFDNKSTQNFSKNENFVVFDGEIEKILKNYLH